MNFHLNSLTLYCHALAAQSTKNLICSNSCILMKICFIYNNQQDKYTATGQEAREGGHIQIDTNSYENVNNFVYSGCQVNTDGKTTEEIKRKLISANRCFFGLRPKFCMFQSRIISRSITLFLPGNQNYSAFTKRQAE